MSSYIASYNAPTVLCLYYTVDLLVVACFTEHFKDMQETR